MSRAPDGIATIGVTGTILVVLGIGWLVTIGITGSQEKEKCLERCDPYQAKMIDGVCHCRATAYDGWGQAEEP